MDYIYTNLSVKENPRTVVTAAAPLKFQVTTGKTLQYAAIHLFHNGQKILIADSGKLQDQYLFLTAEMCQNLYNEVVAQIRLAEGNAAAVIDVDEILARTAKQHEQKFSKEAVRVNLHFPRQDMYIAENIKYDPFALASRKLLKRYRSEKTDLKKLILKFNSTKGRTPEESVLAAILSLSHARLVSGHPSTPGNHQNYREWLRSLLSPEDLSALVLYCSRPELAANRHLEQVLYLLVHNCPPYPSVYVSI